MQCIKNEKGFIWVTLSLITIPFVLIIIAFVIDLAHGVWVNAQLQTAADAASMAGALTAVAVADKEIALKNIDSDGDNGDDGDEEGDDSGKVPGATEKINGWTAVIEDPDLAREKAQQAAIKNTTGIAYIEGGFGQNEKFNPTGSDFRDRILDDDNYYVCLKTSINTIFIGKVLKLFGQSTTDKINIETYSISKAYPDPELPVGLPPDKDGSEP